MLFYDTANVYTFVCIGYIDIAFQTVTYCLRKKLYRVWALLNLVFHLILGGTI